MRITSSIFISALHLASVFAAPNEDLVIKSGFGMDKNAVEGLVKGSRRLDDGNQQMNKHISAYSIQFQGCHHIQQWDADNEADNGDDDAAAEEDVRLETKRLVRYRLVPYDTCENVPAWATAFDAIKEKFGSFDDYGEYIVDMNTFVYYYLLARSAQGAYKGDCSQYSSACSAYCGAEDGEEADEDCLQECYGLYACQEDNYYEENEDAMAILDYAQCAAFGAYNGDDDGGQEYYMGPYCADSGAAIRMSLFSDDTCTTTARCNKGQTRGSKCFAYETGHNLPFASGSIVDDPCVPCTQNYADLEGYDGEMDDYDFGYPREVCTAVYQVSGKCENHMQHNYEKYDNACEYIQGIAIAVSNDGIVMTVKRSGKADIVMGVLAISTVLLAMYVYYLKSILASK